MAGHVGQTLSGWGRFPVESGHLFRPETRAGVTPVLASDLAPSYLARGLGRSYGDAALNRDGGLISTLRLNRLLAFDATSGVLHCEAGVSFAEIIAVFLPRGWFLPVTPGTRFVTVGGAIAMDVHGKNHHRDGSLGRFVVDLELLTPAGEVLTCSPTSLPEIFWATVGGCGLTGVILSARLRLQPVETAYALVDYQRAPDIEAALAGLAAADTRYEYSVAWIDCLRGGRSLGRSVLMGGNRAPLSEVRRHTDRPLALLPRRAKSVPFDLPALALNRVSVAAFNALYYALHPSAAGRLVDFGSFFYPLDAVLHWNRVYGRRGFVQYQVMLPPAGSRAGLIALLERLSGSGRASFLAVLKRFGPGDAGLLSFPGEGYTLALDLPVTAGLVPFLRQLDAIVLARGGRVYLAKDAVLTPETFAVMYPRLPEFRAIQRALDPEGRLSSSLARRLRILTD